MSDDLKRRNVVRRTPFPRSATSPLVPPIVPSAVFVARDADHMNDVYEGREQGFTYAREGSPNADLLATKIAALEDAEAGLITSSGMSAVAAIVLGLLKAGDHIVASNQLYGRTLRLVTQELPRLGFSTGLVDATDVAAVDARDSFDHTAGAGGGGLESTVARGGRRGARPDRPGAGRAPDCGQHVSNTTRLAALDARRARCFSQYYQDARGA